MSAQMLRIAEGAPAPVTDHESDDAKQIATRNTAEAAMKRLGFGEPDPERDAWFEKLLASNRGEICFDCERRFDDKETIFKQSIRRNVVFGWKRETVSYCESCDPRYWDAASEYCRTCQRIVVYPSDERFRVRVFCSDRCKRDHYSKVQRDKRLVERQKQCSSCTREFVAPRKDTKFCSAACKQKAYRARQGVAS